MIDTRDIRERIETYFGEQAAEVILIFDKAISAANYLKDDRIIRCILFLSAGDLEKLKKNVKAATDDPRDVMYWAEYSNHDQPHQTTRVRDFSKAFDEAENGLK